MCEVWTSYPASELQSWGSDIALTSADLWCGINPSLWSDRHRLWSHQYYTFPTAGLDPLIFWLQMPPRIRPLSYSLTDAVHMQGCTHTRASCWSIASYRRFQVLNPEVFSNLSPHCLMGRLYPWLRRQSRILPHTCIISPVMSSCCWMPPALNISPLPQTTANTLPLPLLLLLL